MRFGRIAIALLLLAYGVAGYVQGRIWLPGKYGSGPAAFEGVSASLFLAGICCFAIVMFVRAFDVNAHGPKAAVLRKIEKAGLVLTAVFAVAAILKSG